MTHRRKTGDVTPREIPSVDLLEEELKREKYRQRYRRALRNTIYTLITVAAAAVLVATLLLPVLQISGTSMAPNLTEGDIVVSMSGKNYKRGDVIAFYFDNKVLVKRVIATAGQWVDIDEEGNVFIDGEAIDEPYLTEKSLGQCNIELPYQVPESQIFVMGDHRGVSLDSRNTAVGCVSDEQIVGRLIFRVWPIGVFGPVG